MVLKVARVICCLALVGRADDEPETLSSQIGEQIDKVVRLLEPRWNYTLGSHLQGQDAPGGELHATVISTSMFFQNYRHTANAAAIYRVLQWLGVPASRAQTMIADCHACDPRNSQPGTLFVGTGHDDNMYTGPLTVGMRAGLSDSQSLKNLISRRLSGEVGLSSRLMNNRANDDVLIYLNGHGGTGFTKFRDYDELSNVELAETLNELKVKRGFRRMLIMLDSCQALTLGDEIKIEDVLVVASSVKGKSAYSCLDDARLGVSLMDRFTHLLYSWFRDRYQAGGRRAKMKSVIDAFDEDYMMTETGVRTDLLRGFKYSDTLVSDWFSSKTLGTPGPIFEARQEYHRVVPAR